MSYIAATIDLQLVTFGRIESADISKIQYTPNIHNNNYQSCNNYLLHIALTFTVSPNEATYTRTHAGSLIQGPFIQTHPTTVCEKMQYYKATVHSHFIAVLAWEDNEYTSQFLY